MIGHAQFNTQFTSTRCLGRAARAVRAVVSGLALGCAAVAMAQTSTQLVVNGGVLQPSTYNLAGLQALPAITQTDTFLSSGVSQTHVYTGASLWNTLNIAGIQTNPSVKNDVLNKVVIATGSDGYKSVFSLGELNPSFGNGASLIAYAETINGVSGPLASDGFARTTAPADVKGGRYVSNLVSLTVAAPAFTATGTGGGESSSFTVSGDVLHPQSFDLGALQGLPTITESAGGNSFTGVSFWDLLNSTVGLATNPAVKNDLLDMVVVATGSDGYTSVFSLGELDPDFGNAPDMIAYSENGQPLPGTGFARVVVPNDVKAGRWVSNLVSLEVLHVTSPVPEPAPWALMFAGLAAIGWRTRKRLPTRHLQQGP